MISTLVRVNEQALVEIEEERKIRKTKDVFLLFSLGSQFDHLIKQMVERIGQFCLVADPSRITAEDVKKVEPTGIFLSGGPVSIYESPPKFDSAIFDLGIPVLGICLGFQYWASHIGCQIVASEKREFSAHDFSVIQGSLDLFADCGDEMQVLESHGDKVIAPEKGATDGFKVLGRTENAEVAAGRYNHLYGLQFHPECSETLRGQKIFENFCYKICGAKQAYPAKDVAQQKVADLQKKIGDKNVLLLLSGGSDSSTTAYLLREAMKGLPGRLKGLYIKGIDRPDDEAHVIEYFGNQDWIELEIYDATEEFLAALAGKTGMDEKRVAMRGVYESVANRKIAEFKGCCYIAQGTLYTDISESGLGYDIGAKKARIKRHHNVALKFIVPELTPLDDQVKDTGRLIGRQLGVPEVLLTRHPFPGPGLIVRISGEVTAEKLAIARQVDTIWIEELRREKLYETVWQAGAHVTDEFVTCTKGDDAVSGRVICLWAVWSVNGFTAQAAELPSYFIKRVCRRMTNEIRQVGSVYYRYSDKPPATIESG